MMPIRAPPSYSPSEAQGTYRPLGAAEQERRIRRRRVLAQLLFGPLGILMGTFLALREGLSIAATMYLGTGGFLLVVAFAEILGLVRLPIWTREDALRRMARRSFLVSSQSVIGVGLIISIVLYPESWPVRVLYVAFSAAFFVGLFAYARRWVRNRGKGSVARIG